MFIDLLKKSRTHRFFSRKKITEEEILKLIETARYSPFSRNSQTIRFAYTVDEAKGLEIFKILNLGGGINEKATKNEAPTGYILICEEDTNTVPLHLFSFNMGCVCQNINLLANEMGYKVCMVGSYDRKKVEEIFELSTNYKSHYLLVIGEGLDKVEIVDIKASDSVKYYRENGIHYLPKIILDDLIIKK